MIITRANTDFSFLEYIKRMRANITPPPGYPLLSSMNRNHFLSSETPPPPKAVVQPLPDPDSKLICINWTNDHVDNFFLDVQIIDKPQVWIFDHLTGHV